MDCEYMGQGRGSIWDMYRGGKVKLWDMYRRGTNEEK